MFYGEYRNRDPYNTQGKRNLDNADRWEYNCGGYALGLFSWYCPYDREIERSEWGDYTEIFTMEKVHRLTYTCVDFMLQDFNGRLREIGSLCELASDEHAIAFRLATDNDFHFVRRSRSGQWFHKRGDNPRIETMPEEEVFSKGWCFGMYNGPLVLLALKD